MLKTLLSIAAIATIAATSIQAATVANGQANIVGADQIIGFDEFDVANGVEVTDEFASLGATFSGLFQSDSGFSPRANTSGALLFRFSTIGATITFNNSVSDATFALSSNAGTGTFTSFLNGTQVETFSASLVNTALPESNVNRVGNIFGFTGSLFDQITFTTAGSSGASFDNLAFNVAPVPLPASLPLLLAGAGAMFAVRRRKSKG